MINKLGPAPVRSQVSGEELTSQRAAVLELLQHSTTALTGSQIASELQLHSNTVREHLGALVERGLISRQRSTPTGRGRPAWRYSAAADGEPNVNVRDYLGLVTALASHFMATSNDVDSDALTAGSAWGVAMAARLQPSNGDAAGKIVAELADLGFEPRSREIPSEVALRRCPILDAAQANPEVVCNVHLGLVRGILGEIDEDDTSADLDAFAEPGACILHLHRGAPQMSKRPATINREEAARR